MLRQGGSLKVGQLIREHRRRRHLTQADLSRQIGISQSELSRIENGEYRVPLDLLFRILRAFEMNLGEFFGELNQNALTEAEASLLNLFRKLSREAQEEVLDFAAFKLSREGR
ncbi:MAG: helix-turn-helix transcriptional regulator [Thermoanaerobaculaceae bacterium]